MFDQVSPIVMPRSSVMRFDKSAEMSHSVAAGTSPVFDHATVGKDISSATQGSSVASVAGKKDFVPTTGLRTTGSPIKNSLTGKKFPRQRGKTDRNSAEPLCPLLARSGHHSRADQCPLSGVKRTIPSTDLDVRL